MNPWLNKSYVCWSWNAGQETPDVLNSIIYVAINKNTSITVIPELANNIMTHTNTLGKYQHNQLSCISPPAMQSSLPGEKVFHCSWSNPTHLWLTNKGTIYNGYTWFCLFLLLTYRFCLSKLHQRRLVPSISKTRYCLWLQCQWHNKWGESESECLWSSIASLEPWGRDVLNLINRDWTMRFTPGRVVYRFSSAQMFLQRLAEIKTSAADFTRKSTC